MSNKVDSESIQTTSKDKAIVLALDTTTQGCCVSIAKGFGNVVTVSSDKTGTHSFPILYEIKNAFDKGGVSIEEIDLYAVASGPGSFTGIRVGISTVKGLAASTGKPCVGINSLKALAHSAGTSKSTCAVISCGRSEVISQMFSVDKDSNVCEINKPSSSSFSELMENVSLFERVLWVGNAVAKHSEEMSLFVRERKIELFNGYSDVCERELPQRSWLIHTQVDCMSRSVAHLAYRAYLCNRVTSAELIQAEYVRVTEFEITRVKPNV